jgi:hypothetical protein
MFPRALIAAFALTTSLVSAHYANMGMKDVTCYIYNGIKGTPNGHMIVRNANGTWYDHDDASKTGTITVVHDQAEYDRLPVKTKIGIVCAPDNTDTTEIGIPYVEMEPSDAEFYSTEQTVYTRSLVGKRFKLECVIKFCRGDA